MKRAGMGKISFQSLAVVCVVNFSPLVITLVHALSFPTPPAFWGLTDRVHRMADSGNPPKNCEGSTTRPSSISVECLDSRDIAATYINEGCIHVVCVLLPPLNWNDHSVEFICRKDSSLWFQHHLSSPPSFSIFPPTQDLDVTCLFQAQSLWPS